MSLSSLRSLAVVAIMTAGVCGRPAVAQGLLHKHAQRPLGAPMALPGQQGVASAVSASATVAVDPSTAVQAGGAVSSPGAAPGGPAVVAIAPGADPGVDVAAIDPGGAVGDGMICVMPLPDGQPGHPHVFHALKPGATDGSPGMLVGPPAVDPGFVDPGLGDMVSIMPLLDASLDNADVSAITAFTAAPAGKAGHPHAGHDMMMARVTAAGGQGLAPARGAGGQARFGGLPNRAAGMRADAIQGQPGGRAVAGASRTAAAPAGPVPGPGPSTGAVRQASATEAAKVATGQARVPAQAAEAPRWRDRLRFAWPTTK